MGSSPTPHPRRKGDGRGNAAVPLGSIGKGDIDALVSTRAGVGRHNESRWGDGGGDDIAMTKAGAGRHDESGWRVEEDKMTMATAMSSRGGQAVDNTTRGGADNTRHRCCYGGGQR